MESSNAPLVSRTGRKLTQEQFDTLAAFDEYVTVRRFKSPQGELEIRWVGSGYRAEGDIGPFWTRDEDDNPINSSWRLFDDEQSAIDFYEDRLASMNCGEWITAQDGRSLFLPIGNMAHEDRRTALALEKMLIGEGAIVNHRTRDLIGSW